MASFLENTYLSLGYGQKREIISGDTITAPRLLEWHNYHYEVGLSLNPYANHRLISGFS